MFRNVYGPHHHHHGNGSDVTVTIKGEGGDLVQQIVKALRYDIRTNGGGNVQRYLGHGLA